MSGPKFSASLAQDSAGRLYDPAVRASLKRMAGADSRPLEAVSALRLAAKRLHDATQRWAESHGLTESRLQILTYLYISPGHQLPLGALAEAQSLAPRTVTGLIDNLERDGLVRRIPDPSDRRSVRARLTKAGLARMEAMRIDATARQAAGAGGLNTSQLAELRHLCLLLVRHVDSIAGEA
ncbi:MAG TPA: MarR family transcriptional regulator [Candidatus Limnocylindria bacterium]|nr:MarR family transcriptional regulator [Candidatus Limnocylindria bacterium]